MEEDPNMMCLCRVQVSWFTKLCWGVLSVSTAVTATTTSQWAMIGLHKVWQGTSSQKFNSFTPTCAQKEECEAAENCSQYNW